MAHLEMTALRSGVAMTDLPKDTDTDTDPGPVVCIVDDDDGVVDSLTALLQTYGFDTLGCESAIDLLATIQRYRIGCLIVDHHMPAMTGIEMVAELHRRGYRPPTILLTGRLDPVISAAAQQLGFTAVLEKPFPIGQLVALIQGVLTSVE
jgi:FixJ family two-component response regulator